MKEAYAALANRIRATLHDVERVVVRAEFLLAQAQAKTNLHSYNWLGSSIFTF